MPSQIDPSSVGREAVERCARPNCRSGPGCTRSDEFRIHGYCSCECEDMHELEQEIDELRAATSRLRREAMVEAAKLVCRRCRERHEPQYCAALTSDWWHATTKPCAAEAIHTKLAEMRNEEAK